MDFEDRIMAEIKAERALHGDDRYAEARISGFKRALVLAVGQERAEAVFAAHDESY